MAPSAKIAGVGGSHGRADAGGEISPAVSPAAKIGGVTEVYRIGGAQAIGALAYGTATIARSTKSSAPVTLTSRRRSARCSARSAST